MIKGASTGLSRPEGVVFTPDGHYMVIANSGDNSLITYRRQGESGASYSTQPLWHYTSNEYLKYVHDVTFTHSGEYLGCVCRENNMVVVFKRNDPNEGVYEMKRAWHMAGSPSALDNPTGLAFCLDNDVLCVANRIGGNGLNFYQPLDSDAGHYDTYPYQQITEDESLQLGIASPHGVAFSHDGRFLAALHKKYHVKKENKGAKGISALVLYEKNREEPYSYFSDPAFIVNLGDAYLHSIDFHPTDKYIAVTHEKDHALIFERVGEGPEYCFSQKTPSFTATTDRKLKAKGVAFSRQGDSLAVTFENDSVIVYAIEEKP